jgi:hypothetical protein
MSLSSHLSLKIACFLGFFEHLSPVMPVTVLPTFRDTFEMSLFVSPYVLSARIP